MLKFELSPLEYQHLTEFIYQKTGLRFAAGKEYYLNARVGKRLQELGVDNFRQYFNFLRFGSPEKELELLINSITVNETYFFREYNQLKCFAEEVLPLLAKELKAGERLKVWSAGCSSGEEPYTLAIILTEMLEVSGINFEVHGTDINTLALHKAKKGCYEKRSLREMPEEYLQKYFLPKDALYQVRPQLKEHVHLYQLNLKDEKAMEAMRGFHSIFCRNVLIYFDDQSRREAALGFYRALLPGGFIFLGHSESMGRISNLFKPLRFKEAIIYQKR